MLTIRRLEHNDFSPRLDTLRKLMCGLEMQLSTLFLGYELHERAAQHQVLDLFVGRTPREIEFGVTLLRSAYEAFDAAKGSDEENDD